MTIEFDGILTESQFLHDREPVSGSHTWRIRLGLKPVGRSSVVVEHARAGVSVGNFYTTTPRVSEAFDITDCFLWHSICSESSVER